MGCRRQLRPLRRARVLAGLTLAFVLMLCGPGRAFASVTWRIASLSNSTVQPGGQLNYHVQIADEGDEPTDGSPVTLTVELPAGMTGVSADTTGFAAVGGFDCPSVAGATGSFTCTGSPSCSPSAFAE